MAPPGPLYRWVNDVPQWSPDGRYILYNHYFQTPAEEANGDNQIWSVDLTTGETQFRAPGSNAQWLASDAAFTFSAAGVCRFDLGSSQTTPLVACGGAAQASPDGRFLALMASCPSVGGPGPVLFDLATKSGHAIDSLGYGWMGSPSWSPDGTRLAISYIFDNSGAEHLAVVDTSGRNLTRLTPLDFHFEDRSATWSHDGNWIYWDRLGNSGNESQSGIWRIHPDGTGEQMVVRDGFYPSLAPGDTAMAFAKFDSLHVFNLWICDKDGGHQRPLFPAADSLASSISSPPLGVLSPEAAYLLRRRGGTR